MQSLKETQREVVGGKYDPHTQQTYVKYSKDKIIKKKLVFFLS